MIVPGKFWGGTSGLVLAEPNKAHYPVQYQDKSRLTYYASKNNSLEINSSFYKIPRGDTYRKWAEMVPDDFQFTVKLWKGITHEKGMMYSITDLEKFMEAVRYLGTKKGCLLIQFPASAIFPEANLIELLKLVRKIDPEWRLAVEFRHRKWYIPEMYQMLESLEAALVIHDMSNSIPEKINTTLPFVYLRFHGEKGDYRGSYEDAFLYRVATDIIAWIREGKDVYAYFNNTAGDAVNNLNTLRTIVNRIK